MALSHNNPLRLLPPEIWSMIFEYLTPNPLDLSNIVLASPLGWDNLLKSWKPSFLMTQVLPVLSPYLGDKPSILRCRLVSKTWKSAVDTYLQRHPCIINLDGIHHDKEDSNHDLHQKCWRRTTKAFHCPEAVQTFLRETMDLYAEGQNPFVTRSVILGDHVPQDGNENEAVDAMWLSIRSLLMTYGFHIWHLTLISTAQRNGPAYYNLIHDFLSLLPNLRTLELCFVVKPCDIQGSQCQTLIDSKPLPELAHMETIKTSYIPSVLLNALLRRYQGTLRNLQVATPQWYSHLCDYDESIGDFSNLRQLSIPLRYTLDIWKIQRSGWLPKVDTLSLDISFQNLSSKSDLQKLFDVLESESSQNLRHLNLELSVSALHEKGKTSVDTMARLRLSRLRKLRIHAKLINFNSIDFILGLANLHELILILQDSEPLHQLKSSSDKTASKFYQENVVKFSADYLEDMYQSNVWDLLPKLEKISVWIRDLSCFRYNHSREDFNYVRSQVQRARQNARLYRRRGLRSLENNSESEPEPGTSKINHQDHDHDQLQLQLSSSDANLNLNVGENNENENDNETQVQN